MNQQLDSAIKILCDFTMKAYVEIARQRKQTVDPERAATDTRDVIKKNIERIMQEWCIMQEWRDALDANISEGWMQTLLKTQAIEMAIEALKKTEQ